MNAPKYLNDEAKRFWKRHAKRLADAGMLTEADTDSFALVCELWSLIRATDPLQDSKMAIRYVGLLKLYNQYSRQFGLLPKDRIQAGLQQDKEEKDEFGLS